MATTKKKKKKWDDMSKDEKLNVLREGIDETMTMTYAVTNQLANANLTLQKILREMTKKSP